MYIEVYDRNLEHVTNISNVKYNLTRRVFDFDTSLYEGKSENSISSGFIFVLCSPKGEALYSGFMENIKQNASYVSFKGGDFKKVFDTEVILDYATELGLSPKVLGKLFNDVSEAVINDIGSLYPIEITYPNPTDPIDWIANYDSQYIIINALTFLKPYLAYFDYYINAYFDRNAKKVKIEIKINNSTFEIKLDDFVHDITQSGSSINKAKAVMKYDNVEPDFKMWIESSEAYWNMVSNKDSAIQGFPEPVVEANDFDYGFALKITYREAGIPEDVIYYYQVSNKAEPRPVGLPERTYYLGNDNQIYEGLIPANKAILPVKGKVFEDTYFQKAQYKAITELINNRYNENIIITNTFSPIDLNELKLYMFIKVYDKNGNFKTLPVSEIEMNNESHRVKLGFKKTLFTEVIKNESNNN